MGQGHQSMVFEDKDYPMMPPYIYNNPMSNLVLPWSTNIVLTSENLVKVLSRNAYNFLTREEEEG
jgi:hypothetical protein